MKQKAFEERHQKAWQDFEMLLVNLEGKRSSSTTDSNSEADFPALYRSVCHHLALARDRQYSSHLVNQLHGLVLRGHQQLYTQKLPFVSQIIRFLLSDFPSTLRREARLFWFSTALFLLPALIMGWLCYIDREMIYSVHSVMNVAEMEAMYDPENSAIGREERASDSDFFMFGYYIYNNIGIGFRTFASGLLYGIGTVFVLLSNGVFIGSVAGHLTQRGFTDTFWPFVSGHGAFELTAIVICGVAGLQLARALYSPGRQRRINALKQASLEAVPLVIGATLMLFIAAFIEAFWSSSSTLTNETKYGVAAILWLLVICYFLFAGKGRGGYGSR
ncbi:FIG01248689: hypothetical protein [hydrothermal vent metagenome]|uniref:Stage II sporulation protein M n=1 Tax=hydrothermal vent metagenome TaxID=652676 RepID=A0A3B0ZHK5_9ZZZZ